MKKLRWFKCLSSNEKHEKLVEDNIKTIICNCGSQANRAISAAKYLNNTVGKYPAIR